MGYIYASGGGLGGEGGGVAVVKRIFLFKI
jgi:hypothetical protein